jgi:hypothetical protein
MEGFIRLTIKTRANIVGISLIFNELESLLKHDCFVNIMPIPFITKTIIIAAIIAPIKRIIFYFLQR